MTATDSAGTAAHGVVGRLTIPSGGGTRSRNADSQSPPSSGHMPLPRRGRVALACQRCKRRKQRCDGGSPECSSCRKADVQCIYERAIRPRYPGGKSLYINALEERIAFLEARMPEYGQDHFNANTIASRQAAAAAATSGEGTQQDDLPSRRPSTGTLSDGEGSASSSLVDGVAYLSLCAAGATDTAPEPFYLGNSSGANIARLIQSSIFRAAKPPSLSPSPNMRADVLRPSPPSFAPQVPFPTSPNGFGAAGHPGGRHNQDEFPRRAQAQALFSVFFDRLHTRWPILDRREYRGIFERQYDQPGALSLVQRSILHLIYAISARFLQLMKKNYDVDPERHFAAAIEPMDYILEQHNLATVQFLVLLAIHSQRSPYGAGAWSQVRYAMTLCIELGLHRKRTARGGASSARDLEIRRRCFWACYCLDRTTSTVLGRTFAIADRDINVELPSAEAAFADLTSSSSTDPATSDEGTPDFVAWSNILPFVHIIKLRKIQSKIHRTVFRVDQGDAFLSSSSSDASRAKLDGKIAALQADLEEWVRTIPTPPPPAYSGASPTWMYDSEPSPAVSTTHKSRDFFLLQYHKTLLSLFSALLPTLSPTDPRFLQGARSAAAVCAAYRRLNAARTLSYTLTALHSCFVAGLTLIYCLWRHPPLFSARALDAQRACSLCLTVFGEKWPGAVKYRDVFDALSAGLFRRVVSGEGKGENEGDRPPLDIRLDQGGGVGAEDGLDLLGDGIADTIEVRVANSARDGTETMNLDGFDWESALGGNTVKDNSCGSGEAASRNRQGKRTAGNMVLGAVKEAFMEVDEEAPGGWQGWRMFSEMVQVPQGGLVDLPDIPVDPGLVGPAEAVGESGGQMDMLWGDALEGRSEFYEEDIDVNMGIGLEDSGWEM